MALRSSQGIFFLILFKVKKQEVTQRHLIRLIRCFRWKYVKVHTHTVCGLSPLTYIKVWEKLQVSLGYWEVINPETNSYTWANQDNTKGSWLNATNKDAQILSVSAIYKMLFFLMHKGQQLFECELHSKISVCLFVWCVHRLYGCSSDPYVSGLQPHQ